MKKIQLVLQHMMNTILELVWSLVLITQANAYDECNTGISLEFGQNEKGNAIFFIK